MHPELISFAARLRGEIALPPQAGGFDPGQFPARALELFRLQYEANPAYRRLCENRRRTPAEVRDWTEVPFVPTAAFKEVDLSCLLPAERTATFHSSGTTEQKPSRHFHGPESLAVYEASLWSGFAPHFADPAGATGGYRLVFLTPPPAAAPHSSLVHMFEVVRQRLGAEAAGMPGGGFAGAVGADGAWNLDTAAVLAALNSSGGRPFLILGTAFTFVHLLDYLAGQGLRSALPPGSRVMETGGYKNRSRVLPKAGLHALITDRLGIAPENIVCEYGMSELSSQAYDRPPGIREPERLLSPARSSMPPSGEDGRRPGEEALQGFQNSIAGGTSRPFHFPPWARAQILSPESGREVAEGETGLIRIFDLANVFSVAAIQTEDLGVRHGAGFELLGRAAQAEPRGCSLNSLETRQP